MKLASLIVIGALCAVARQDEWLALPLARMDSAPDSVMAAGLTLTAGANAVEVVLGIDNSCESKVSAQYQAHGQVVKIRLTGLPAGRSCPAVHRPEAYRATVAKLKPKRYQVIVYTADAKGHWRPWKAAVTDVS